MTPELLSITFSVPVYYTDQELDIIEEELKDVEDVTSVSCDSSLVTVLDLDPYGPSPTDFKETLILFTVQTDNYNHIIGRLNLAIKDVLKRITPEYG